MNSPLVPASPGLPGAPLRPGSPRGPIRPVGPGSPGSPLLPAGPISPGGPAIPSSPLQKQQESQRVCSTAVNTVTNPCPEPIALVSYWSVAKLKFCFPNIS